MRNILYISFLLCFLGCSKSFKTGNPVNVYPPISPDFTNLCIPYNIAPLNFRADSCQAIYVEISSGNGKFNFNGDQKVEFALKVWKKLLNDHRGDTIWVRVTLQKEGKYLTYKPFFWKVEPEPVDSFISYRLIEPGYEVWNRISISQRNVTNFEENVLADNNLTEGSCMNCHIVNKHQPRQSFFHIRGPKGMTIVADGQNLRSINTKPNGAYSNMIYGNWHPSGRYIAFSTNVVLPSTHAIHDQRAFVYDTLSDVVVLDLKKNEVLKSPLLSSDQRLETFPEFSADGKRLYFCSAKKVKLPEDYKKLQYSLCAIDFDPSTGNFGEKVDTLVNGPALSCSVSELKSSPDGKYIAFTCMHYGTFALWHQDARIYLYNLEKHSLDTLCGLNNNLKYSNSYHSWSVNSRWIAFASKRDNGLYGKIYFSYVDNQGRVTKPFVMPQKDPDFYDLFMKSYNVPELMNNPEVFGPGDIEKIFHVSKVDSLHYRSKPGMNESFYKI